MHVNLSIDVVVYPADGGDAETLLIHADTAMSRPKDAGITVSNFSLNA